MATEVVMPQMGESIAEGTITKWLKQVGDRVERDEPLFEISTDKVDAEIPSPAAGVLTEIKFPEGETVEVNKVVAVLDGAGNGADEGAAASAIAASPSPPAAEPIPAAETTATEQEQVESSALAQEAETPEAEPQPSEVFSPQESTPPVTPVTAKQEEQATAAAPSKPPGSDGPNLNKEASVEDLRRTKSSPLVRKIAGQHNIDIACCRRHRLERSGDQERYPELY